jgi:hypothetical protein
MVPRMNNATNVAKRDPKRIALYLAVVGAVAGGAGWMANWIAKNTRSSMLQFELVQLSIFAVCVLLFTGLSRILKFPSRKLSPKTNQFLGALALIIVIGVLWEANRADREWRKYVDIVLSMNIPVSNIDDEPLVSAQNRVIGIKLHYQARFPRRVLASIILTDSPFAWTKDVEAFPGCFHTLHGVRVDMDPPPSAGDPLGPVVDPSVTYQLTADLVPIYLHRAKDLGQYCIDSGPITYTETGQHSRLTVSELARTISPDKTVKFQLMFFRKFRAFTDHEYRPADFYRNAVAEGIRSCDAKDLRASK